ncbi:Reticulon-4-interacting protein 1, mitochondrial [Orchesella cincta]|uniref:Reticulon-4-interacting protein 1, mitochondrial n=1 Tax=Orchesella cincta TaxID=48709 RepID=A0A1D2NAY6_ORCCI|nr:Reticulon-4-interacting protein 1, mitochondrial [Orchesella cincta]
MMEALVGITKSAMRTRSLSSLLQRCGCRFLSSKSGSPGSDHVGGKFDLPYGGEETMKSWQIHSYGGPSELQLTTSSRVPTINSPNEVLVKVHAASINPIDLAMTKGYGAETINIIRDLCPSASLSTAMDIPVKLKNYLLSPIAGKKSVIEFPLTLGRDFAGVVTKIGHGVKSDIRVGDEVYGVVGIQKQGSHAEYVVVSSDTIRRKPKNLGFVEAASIPYTGLTAWSAIRVTGSYCNVAQRKFLVLGGSGGVGTFAIQYLKSQGATVITTCSTDAVPLVTSMGPDFVIDYMEHDTKSQIQRFAPYDCILHLSGPNTTEKSMELVRYLKPVSGQFITLSPPFLGNVDKYGIVGGTAKNVGDLIMSNLKSFADGKAVTKWAFFIPAGDPLQTFADLIEKQRINPVIQSVYKFAELPDAYRKLEEGHLRGKIVVEVSS